MDSEDPNSLPKQTQQPEQPAVVSVPPPAMPPIQSVVESAETRASPQSSVSGPILEPIGSSSGKPTGAFAILLVGIVLLLVGVTIALVVLAKNRPNFDTTVFKPQENVDENYKSDVEYRPDPNIRNEGSKADTVSSMVKSYIAEHNGAMPTVQQLTEYIEEEFDTDDYFVVGTTPYMGEVQYAPGYRCNADDTIEYTNGSRQYAVRMLLSDNKTYYCTGT